MKPTILITATAVALAGLAGCDRKPEQRAAPGATSTYQTGSPAGAGSSAAAQSNTPTVPANVGPGAKDDGRQPPVQGREDVRQPEQRKDFQQRGDGAGPKPGG